MGINIHNISYLVFTLISKIKLTYNMKKQQIKTVKAPAAIGPYSQAILATTENGDKTLYASGQIAIDPETGKLVEGGIEEQAERVMKNIGGILEEAGMTYANVVKTTCLLADITEFSKFNAIYGKCFQEEAPARSTFAVAALPMSARVEVEVIAVK